MWESWQSWLQEHVEGWIQETDRQLNAWDQMAEEMADEVRDLFAVLLSPDLWDADEDCAEVSELEEGLDPWGMDEFQLGSSSYGMVVIYRGIPMSIGDPGCLYNARSPELRCAVNPDGPCQGCKDYQPRPEGL